jgi:hypothetical protein
MGGKNNLLAMYRDINSAGMGMDHNGAHGLAVFDYQLRLPDIYVSCVYLGGSIEEAIAITRPIIAYELKRARDDLCMVRLYGTGGGNLVAEVKACFLCP